MLLFIGDYYYPKGPSKDFVAVISSIEEVQKFLNENKGDWWEVLDYSGNLVDSGKVPSIPYKPSSWKLGVDEPPASGCIY